MLGSKAPSECNRREESQRATTNDRRDSDRGQVTVQIGRDQPVLSHHLNRLDDPGGQLSAALHLGEVGIGQSTFAQRRAQEVGRGHRIGDGQVDADPTDR